MTGGGPVTPGDYQLIGPSEDGTVSNLLEALAAKESRQRLQALISEWLRMENLVVLTGAGGSWSYPRRSTGPSASRPEVEAHRI